MSQKLILPINNAKLTASWKTNTYKSRFGFIHYGVDMISTVRNTKLYSLGSGKVLKTGLDNVLGNIIVLKYDDCINVNGKQSDLIIRLNHLASIAVKEGQTLTKDTVIGNYGNTGQYSAGAHLHVEVDSDVEHPYYTPTLSGKSTYFIGSNYGATDTTMYNPLEWIYCKASAPDNQTYTTANDTYIRPEDKVIKYYDKSESESNEASIEGIDVSVHNGTVDFKKVKAAGKDFVFVRIGWAGWDGKIVANGGLDSKFHTNMKAAIAAGLNVGVYLYSYCKTTQAAQIAAREVLQLAKPYKLTYPIAFDIEDTSDSGVRYDKMSKSTNTAIVNAFLSVIKQNNYCGILYTYKSFAESYLNMNNLEQHDMWLAQYANKPTYKGDFTIWQYKGDVKGFVGTCPGVVGNCDLNVCYKDYSK